MKFLALISILFLIFPVSQIEAKDDLSSKEIPSGESMLFDLLVLRPLGIGACALGIAVSIVSIPFNLANPNPEYVTKKFITEPFEYTFLRPLGKKGPVAERKDFHTE